MHTVPVDTWAAARGYRYRIQDHLHFAASEAAQEEAHTRLHTLHSHHRSAVLMVHWVAHRERLVAGQLFG